MNCDQLFPLLQRIGWSRKIISLTYDLYNRQQATTKQNRLKLGVRQGCSSDLFNVVAELILLESFGGYGVKVGGRNGRTIKYADDVALLADILRMLQKIIHIK